MDFANIVGQWLLEQLEMVPADLIRQRANLRPWTWLFDRVLGKREAAELQALLDRPPSGRARVATVLIPGIMGSLLASTVGISALLWLNPTLLTNGGLNLLDLNEDGTGDRSPDVQIVPVGIEKLTYLKMILLLAKETRLYEFPYDWRRHLELSADHLHRSIERWSMSDPERRFALIGHSMGGLVARTYLARHPKEAERRISKVLMVGTPLQGATLAGLIFTGGTLPARIVTHLHPDNDVLGFAANLPASYQLLPPPPELFGADRPYPMNWDIYDAAAWGVSHLRQDYLDDARRLHEVWAKSDPQVEMVNIAGCHRRTLTDLWQAEVEDGEAETPRPNFTLVHQERGEDSGDDSVPLWSARRKGVTTYYVEERHQLLPGNQQVLDALLELLHDGSCALPTAVPRPSGLLEQIKAAPLLQQVAELRERIEQGELSREDLEKILFAR